MSDGRPAIPACCFCGRSDYSGPDPSYLTLGTRSEVTKSWWCHVSCFESRLPDMPQPWNLYDYEAETGRPFD